MAESDPILYSSVKVKDRNGSVKGQKRRICVSGWKTREDGFVEFLEVEEKENYKQANDFLRI